MYMLYLFITTGIWYLSLALIHIFSPNNLNENEWIEALKGWNGNVE